MEMMAMQKLHTSKSTSKSSRNIAPDDGQLEDEEDDEDEERDEDDNDEEHNEDDNDEDDNDEDKEDDDEEDKDGDGDDEAVEQHNSVHIFPLDFQ